MDSARFRASSASSIRSGCRPSSRSSHVSASRDSRTGSKTPVYQAVETAANGFTKTSKDNRNKILSDRLNMDRRLTLRTCAKKTETESTKTSGRWSIATFRPISAPGEQKQRFLTRSARAKSWDVRASTPVENDPMFEVVKAAREAKSFKDDVELFQNLEKSLKNPDGDEKKDAAPVFNKRLFASQGTVIMTGEARRLMSINSIANEDCDTEAILTKRELQCLRCITEGLKLIHKGHDFVKDVLSRVVTYEVYQAFKYVPHKSWEEFLSCYYILNGAVEVTYDLRSRESRNVYQANIIYSHGTGEYLGLVSPEGPREDLAPPATIYTKELTQFIRVDRKRFHKLMEKATAMIDKQKRDYISRRSFLTKVSQSVKEKLLHKFTIQEFQPNRVLLAQGDITEFLFIIMTGRCQTYREVYIPEADKEVLFYLTSRDTDDFFGEECVLGHEPSYCTVVTTTITVCLKLHRSALQMVNREKLTKFIEAERHEFISDRELRDMGYKDCVWNKFKHGQIKETLKEGGKLCYLNKDKSNKVLERPPSNEELYLENKRRFVLKGSQFEPVRVQSAIVRGSQEGTFPLRPHTVIGNRVTEESEIQNGTTEDVQKVDSTDSSASPANSSTIMSAAKAREIEKQMDQRRRKKLTIARLIYQTSKAQNLSQSQAMESKEALLKMLDEHGELGLNLKQAWKSENTQETQNFMKNGVLVTMTSEDIVRKAKALADSNADKWKKKTAADDEEEWNTILHAENKQAKMLITANKVRLKDLKRRMTELQKRREREKERLSPRKPYIDENDENIKANDKVSAEVTEKNTLYIEKTEVCVSIDTNNENSDINIAETTAVDDGEPTTINKTQMGCYVETTAISEAETSNGIEKKSGNINKTNKESETTETVGTLELTDLETTAVNKTIKTIEHQAKNGSGKVDNGTNSMNIKMAQNGRHENNDHVLDSGVVEEQEMHDSFNLDIDQEVKINKSASGASRPDSAIGSIESEDTVFDTASIEATGNRNLED